MAVDLVAADVTVTINNPKDLTRRRRLNHVTMTLGDGAKTIAAAGVPLPAKATFGMQVIDDMIILGGGLGYIVEYDPTTHVLFWYIGNDADPNDLATGAAPAASSIRALVMGK